MAKKPTAAEALAAAKAKDAEATAAALAAAQSEVEALEAAAAAEAGEADDTPISLIEPPPPPAFPVPPDMAAEVGVFDAPDFTPQSNDPEPESVTVTVTEEPVYAAPVSAATLAEQEAGRAALVARRR